MGKESKSKKGSIFQVIFGKDIGEIMEVIIGLAVLFFVVMVIVAGVPFIMDKLSTSNKDKDLIQIRQLPQDTQTVIKEIAEVRTQTQNLLMKLEKDIKNSEKLLEKKKNALAKLQNDIDLLKLTPKQLNIIKEHKKSIGEELSFREWLSKGVVLYNIIVTFFISAFFYWLGGYRVKRKIKKEYE